MSKPNLRLILPKLPTKSLNVMVNCFMLCMNRERDRFASFWGIKNLFIKDMMKLTAQGFFNGGGTKYCFTIVCIFCKVKHKIKRKSNIFKIDYNILESSHRSTCLNMKQILNIKMKPNDEAKYNDIFTILPLNPPFFDHLVINDSTIIKNESSVCCLHCLKNITNLLFFPCCHISRLCGLCIKEQNRTSNICTECSEEIVATCYVF